LIKEPDPAGTVFRCRPLVAGRIPAIEAHGLKKICPVQPETASLFLR
jgi:hypothetical protein